MNYLYKDCKVMGVILGVEADYRVAIRGWEHISADEHCRLAEVIDRRDALLEALDSKVVAAYSEEIEKLQKISGEICSLQSSSVIAKQRDSLLEALEDLVSEADFKKAVAGEYGHFEEATLKAKKLIKELKP